MSMPPPPPPPGSIPPENQPRPADSATPFAQQPIYLQNNFGQPVAVQLAVKNNGLAVASMVLGIVGLLLCFLWIPSILAVIFGGIALNQISKNPQQGGKGMAIAGLTLGIIGVGTIVVLLAAGSAPV